MALLLALARKIPRSNALVQAGRWELPAVAPLRRIEGQVLGLIGFGNIPRAVVPKAQAFGLTVIAHDPYVAGDAFAALGVQGVSLDELLARSDFVSVHAPLTPATRGLLTAERLDRLPSNAIVVNVSRGAVIDEPDLLDALRSGRVAGAGLDVFAREPVAAGHPLLALEQVVATPHIGGVTRQSYEGIARVIAENVTAVKEGRAPSHCVNLAAVTR